MKKDRMEMLEEALEQGKSLLSISFHNTPVLTQGKRMNQLHTDKDLFL